MPASPRKKHAGFEYVQSADGISEFVFKKNGLRVLHKADHSSPTATLMIHYPVGARNERLGTTGATHFLEHLLFKGSKRFNKKNGKHIDAVLQARGARMNAQTSFDRTNYYELLPIEHLGEAMAYEADRMRWATFDQKDKDTEMAVVRSELEWDENEPTEILTKELWQTAYRVHPYRYVVIGLREDVENVTAAELREFYDAFYWPDNAVIIIVGDIDESSALALVAKRFSRVPRSKGLSFPPVPKEQEQRDPRRVVATRAGTNPIVALAWKNPPALHPDTPALEALARILVSGKTSRLYRALVDKGLAVHVFGENHLTRDPGLFSLHAVVSDGAAPEEVERVMLEECEKLAKKGPAAEELAKVKERVAAEKAYGRDGSMAVAEQLNEALAAGDWRFYADYLKNMRAVTAADVSRVARAYLVPERSTTGYFLPKKN